MRCAILIIGSLLWDSEPRRQSWRASRLDLDARTHVRAPIRYWRKSAKWSNAFTMVFEPGEPSGQGVLVPCRREMETIDNLIDEASAFWRAEDPHAYDGCLYSPWGCVGVLFGDTTGAAILREQWARYFADKAEPVSLVDSFGRLGISWPRGLDGMPVKADVILAAATRPVARDPSPTVIADAWCAQPDGKEIYFFENVRNGIRTPDDRDIWRRLKERSPSWLPSSAYAEAVRILDAETKVPAT